MKKIGDRGTQGLNLGTNVPSNKTADETSSSTSMTDLDHRQETFKEMELRLTKCISQNLPILVLPMPQQKNINKKMMKKIGDELYQ